MSRPRSAAPTACTVRVGGRRRYLVDEQLYHLGIEPAPRGSFQLRAGLLHRHGLPVGAIGGHGAERIRDGDDPGLERDRGAHEALRVARPIPALVVVQHRIGERRHGGHLAQQARADHRVQANLAPFVLVQRARLEQDPLGDGDLTDVVQQRAEAQTLATLGVETEAPSHGHNVVADLVGVGAQVRVLDPDGLGQHPHHRDIRVTQLALQAPVLQHCPGLIAQRQQDVVVELAEPARAIGTGHHAEQHVGDVDGQGDEVLQLPRRGAGARLGMVIACRPVTVQRQRGETEHHRAVRQLVAEPDRGHDLPVLRRGSRRLAELGRPEEHALLRLQQPRGDLHDHRGHVAGVGERLLRAVELHQLPAQLAVVQLGAALPLVGRKGRDAITLPAIQSQRPGAHRHDHQRQSGGDRGAGHREDEQVGEGEPKNRRGDEVDRPIHRALLGGVDQPLPGVLLALLGASGIRAA